jgi:hypothetical protein
MECQARRKETQDFSTSSFPLISGCLISSQLFHENKMLPTGIQERRLKYPGFQAYTVRHSKSKRTVDRWSTAASGRDQIKQQENEVCTS